MMARYKWIAAIGSMLMVVGCNASPGLMPQVQPLAQSTPQMAAAASKSFRNFTGQINISNSVDAEMIATSGNALLKDKIHIAFRLSAPLPLRIGSGPIPTVVEVSSIRVNNNYIRKADLPALAAAVRAANDAQAIYPIWGNQKMERDSNPVANSLADAILKYTGRIAK